MLTTRLSPTNVAVLDELIFGGPRRTVQIVLADWLYPWPFQWSNFGSAGTTDIPQLLDLLLAAGELECDHGNPVVMMEPDQCDCPSFDWRARDACLAAIRRWKCSFPQELVDVVPRLYYYTMVEEHATCVIGCRGANDLAMARLPYANVLLKMKVGGQTGIPERLPTQLVGAMIHAGHGARMSIIGAASPFAGAEWMKRLPGRYVEVPRLTVEQVLQDVSALWVPDRRYTHRTTNAAAQSPLLVHNCGGLELNSPLVGGWREVRCGELDCSGFRSELTAPYTMINVRCADDYRPLGVMVTNGCTMPE